MGVCASKNVKDEPESDDEGASKGEDTKHAKIDNEIGERLKAIPLLATLTDKERGILGGAVEFRDYKDGENIITQGDIGREFYMVQDGKCSVLVDGKKVNDLHSGDYFGESALINNDPRNASVQAVGDVSCVSLDKKAFKRVVKRLAKRTAVSDEAGAHDHKVQTSTAPENAVRDKTPEQTAMINDAVKDNDLFLICTEEQKRRLISEMWLVDVATNENIIVQGELGNHFYVVEQGFFEIFVNNNRVARGGAGFTFGELAMLYKQPRAATVMANQDSKVWVIDRWTFRSVRTESAEATQKEYDDIIIKAFPGLLAGERARMAGALDEVTYAAQHTIFRQGDQGETFFIVRTGEVKVTQERDGKETELVRYGPGQFFGERSLITSETRAASVSTTRDSNLVFMHVKDFVTVLGPVEHVFADRMASYEGKTNPANREAEADADAADNEVVENFLTDIKLEDLEVVGTLGRGSFGHVQLVKDTSGNPYALKKVNKTLVVDLGQQEHIMSEKNVMAQLNHPFLIKLYATYKDHNRLYFLLEPSLGGELFTILREKFHFDHPTARFYAAGIVLAFEYMHSKGIIYRDLKPENLLLSQEGYIKITDFGFAKKIGNSSTVRTWTLCGTPDYLAPEVVAGFGHGKAVDWWTLGILIFEMLASYPPFYDDNQMKTYAKIMTGKCVFPKHFNKASVELIKKLLTSKSAKRLGVTNGGAKAIKTHAFFKGFDWTAFGAMEMKAPIDIEITDPYDISNFEQYDEEPPVEEEYNPTPEQMGWDDDF